MDIMGLVYLLVIFLFVSWLVALIANKVSKISEEESKKELKEKEEELRKKRELEKENEKLRRKLEEMTFIKLEIVLDKESIKGIFESQEINYSKKRLNNLVEEIEEDKHEYKTKLEDILKDKIAENIVAKWGSTNEV